jgi:CRP/FNR family transcriptional regulator, cyclic AMP receptor protein
MFPMLENPIHLNKTSAHSQTSIIGESDPAGVLVAAQRVPFLSMVFRRLDSQQKEIVSVLRQTPVFAELRERELISLLHLLHLRTFAPGEIVFREGEPGLGLYVIYRGEIEISTSGRDGKGRVARIGPGEVFGEVSFLDGSGRSASASARTRTELIGFYRTELLQLLEREPSLASKILFALARQLGTRLRAMLQSLPAS